MRFFVSAYFSSQPPAATMIHHLRELGHRVEHSPQPPEGASIDPRWEGWYPESGQSPGSDSRCGLGVALNEVDACVIVIDQAWDSSTWMAIEADEALARLGVARLFCWDPDQYRPQARGMFRYLNRPLPEDVAEAAATLVELGASNGITPDFDASFAKLADLLQASGLVGWDEVKITESVVWDERGAAVSLGELRFIEDFRRRYTELVTAGWPWVNLNAMGLLGETLILTVEYPQYDPTGVSPTSVNLSGPDVRLTDFTLDPTLGSS